MMKLTGVFLLFFGLILVTNIWAQPCDLSTPTFNVDFTNTSNPWESPSVTRAGACCGELAPSVCVEFYVTINSATTRGVIFDIATGAVPPGPLMYVNDCGATVALGNEMTLSGNGPHRITFCKPGNNLNTYTFIPVCRAPLSVTLPSDNMACGTLRNAVDVANNNPGPDEITFAISDTTILLNSELQVLDSMTTIDGRNNNITIRPSSSFPSTDRSVVWIRRPRSVLKNLTLDCRFAFNIDTLRWGVWFEQAGADYTPRSKVENCEIGYAQGAGVVFESTQDTVINCWIHDYGIIGVLPMGGTDNYVLDCKIGTNKSGNAIQSLPGSFAAYGIDVTFENNVLAGTDTFVVLLAGNNTFIGNKVGVGQNGITTLGVTGNGVIVTASGNTIGDGTKSGANIISGNGGSGIVLDSAFDNTISMNCIGTDKGGTRSIPNGNHGIEIRNQSSRNAIKQNKIAHNLVDGINISGPQVDSNTFVQNLIFDNGNLGISISGGAQVNVNPPTITQITEFKILGTASQNGYVQVFADDAFQGAYFVAEGIADGSGNWSFSYNPYGFPYGLEYVLAIQDSANSTSGFGNRVFVDANSFTPPEITSYNGVSPNGDGINDVLYIENIRFHDDNRVKIYNRWGDKVADIENYDNVNNVWRGENQYTNQPLPDGTYYYVVLLETEKRLSGFVELKH